MKEAVSERRKAFAATRRSDKDRQAYISASRHASSVIAKAKAWQATCSSLSLLRSVGWFTAPLPWDGDMARTAIQVQAFYLN